MGEAALNVAAEPVIEYTARGMALARDGLDRKDVDVLELYDPFSFEIIRQLGAYRFCAEGEGGPFAEDGRERCRRALNSRPVQTTNRGS